MRVRTEGFFDGVIDWRLDALDAKTTRLTLYEQTETKLALINLTAHLGGRRLLEWHHRVAMWRGEQGLLAALARGYTPPDLDGV